MELEVTGRHALFFDDDAMAAFVNSSGALVDWNSLPIDRYDVRHLLAGPPPPRKRRRQPRSSSSPPPHHDLSLESELDRERYLDLLPELSDDRQGVDNGVKYADNGAYNAVGFSYGNPDNPSEQKNVDDDGLVHTGFRPPFPVPDDLLQNLPPTEKVHLIIARTALFVSKHGGQSEIVLRVKHGDNPAFGFLMPDHRHHAYFRFLVDNKFLISSIDEKSQEDENNQTGGNVGGGALSLLGSVYGSGEDEDGASGVGPESEENKPVETSDALKSTISHGLDQTVWPVSVSDETTPKHVLSVKEKTPASKRNGLHSAVKVVKKSVDTSGHPFIVDKSQDLPVPTTIMDKTSILEPPSDTKRVIDKIVEFILKNGRDFEAVLIEQDAKHGRFPFLVPSNKYYPYYLKILSKAQESKLTGKSERDDPMGRGTEKKAAVSKGSDAMSAGHDIPFDSERKEKFKMVIGKSKKDGQEQPSKSAQQQVAVHMDAASAAAILQAATRGIRIPDLGFLSKTTLNSSHGFSSEGGQPSQPQSSVPKPDVEPGVSVPFAKAIAETAALAAASEADSAEACLTRAHKLKAERLKRAKMFAFMIKSGAAPLKTGTSRGLSVELPDPGLSGSGARFMGVLGVEREGSSYPPDFDITNEIEKNEGKYNDDEYHKRSKRTYRKRLEEAEEGDDMEEEEMEEKEERNHKHSRKKRHTHHSSNHGKERRKHHKRHSSSKDNESRHRHKQDESSDGEDHRRGSSKRRYQESSDEGDHHRKKSSKHWHHGSSDEEDLYQRKPSKHRHNRSSDEEDHHQRKPSKHRHSKSSDEEDHRLRKSSKHRDNEFLDEDYPRRKSFKHRDVESSDEDDHCRKKISSRKHCDFSDEEEYHGRKSSKHGHNDFSGEDNLERKSSKYRHQEFSDEDDNHRRKSSKRRHHDFYDKDSHRIKSSKHRKKSLSEKETELEEGEISPKHSDHSKASVGISREASLDVSNSAQAEGAAISQTAEVSDDLRAKVRAMLLATL